MMAIAYFRQMLDYNYWRNHKILSKAALVQPWQYVAPTTFPWVSLHATLSHVVGVEWLWFQRLHAGESPKAPLGKDDFASLKDVVARGATVERDWRRWLNQLTDADLGKTMTYKMLSGKEVQDPLWQCVMQVVNHGTQHCAELAQMLTDCGQSPGNIDFVYYMRESKDP